MKFLLHIGDLYTILINFDFFISPLHFENKPFQKPVCDGPVYNMLTIRLPVEPLFTVLDFTLVLVTYLWPCKCILKVMSKHVNIAHIFHKRKSDPSQY